MLTYAIGDIHGCLSLLDDLLARIDRDAKGLNRRLVCLGDYVDRGPDSAGVVARLRALQDRAGEGVVCLKGNHEDLMLRAFAGPEAVQGWLLNGGEETLDSFGIRHAADLPRDVVAWAGACPTFFRDARRYYVHAGLDPSRSVDDQLDRDRLWIRDAFLAGDHDFGSFVVHGHTPSRSGRPELRRHRVNLDTGAVFGGPLTAAIFTDGEDGPVGFLQAGA